MNKIKYTPFVLIPFLILFFNNESRAAEFNFQSAQDNFNISVDGGVAKFNGTVVNDSSFSAIKPLFELNLAEGCDKISGRPEVTITRTLSGGKTDKRLLYYEKGLVSDGSSCATITGGNLYSLPLHRNWFVGKNIFTIGLDETFSIVVDGKTLIEFVKTKNGFRNKDKDFFTNWDFFTIYKDSINDFKVDYRIHPAGAKNNLDYELHTGGKIYKFVKVGVKTWAVQFPGSAWYAASGQFSVFEEMKQNLWVSPMSKQLSILKNSSAPAKVRAQALSTVKTSPSLDVKVVLQDMLLDPNESNDLKSEIVSVFKYKPTDENFATMISAMSQIKDITLLNQITKVLRIRNPKGPIINDDDESATYSAKIREWESWRKTMSAPKN